MHHPQCVMVARDCRLGEPGHCEKCPHRGQHDPRWLWVQRLASLAPHWNFHHTENRPYSWRPENVDPERASALWPEAEREWIESTDAWADRADYHASMAKNALIRELLREVHDLRRTTEDAG